MPFNITPKLPTFDSALLGPMQELWENSPELSVRQIGARLGVTKNVVIGQAYRRGWKRAGSEPAVRPARHPRNDPDPPSFDRRIDALHTSLDVILAETRAYVEDRPKMYLPVDERRRRR